jgi:hypothetical protein
MNSWNSDEDTMFRQILAATLFLFIVSVNQTFADVTYSYVTDLGAYSGPPGTPISVQLFLKETVTSVGNDTTSLINRTFATDKFNSENLFTGLASVGVAVQQTTLSAGGTASTIGNGQVIVTPSAGSYNGVGNTNGFTFGPNFQYTFTQNSVGQLTGGGPQALLYQNVNDAGGSNGNNLQVKAAFNTNGVNSDQGFNKQNGVITDATYNGVSDTYSTGMILIGTLHIYPGAGTTTFKVVPVSTTSMTNPNASTFNTLSNQAVGFPGTGAGLPTRLSPGGDGLPGTVLAANMFGSAPIDLDTSYTSQTRSGSTAYNTFNSINSTTATAGPNASPASTSFLPFYSADPTAAVFTVTAVPEPGSLALCGLLAFAGAGYAGRRKRNLKG